MKRSIIFLLLLIPFVGMAQIKIQMQEDGGVYKIPCEVNGLRMKFIFDTGATNVCISLTEATFMLENDYISKDDILGTSKSQIADGSIVENTRIRLKEIKIEDLVLKDVEAVVTHNFGAPLLLGQSAIQKLGTIQIVGNELTILEYTTEKSDTEIEKMFEEARSLYSKKLYTAAAKKYQQLYDLGHLSDYGIFKLALSYYFSGKDKPAISYLEKIKDFSEIDIAFYYNIYGSCYRNIEDFDNAVYCFELESTHEEDQSLPYRSKHSIALVYKYKGNYYKAAKCFEELINLYLAKKDVSPEEFLNLRKNSKIKDDIFDEYMFEASLCFYRHYNCSPSYLEHIVGLAKIGNKFAIEYLQSIGSEELIYM